MAGRTFYQLANGNLNKAGAVRRHNAAMREAKSKGQLLTGSPNFGGTSKFSKGEIDKQKAMEIVKNGDIIARKGKDGKVERIKVTSENRDQVLSSNSGEIREQFILQPAGQKSGDIIKRGTVQPFREGKKLKSRGESGKAPRKASSIFMPKYARALEGGKPVKSKKQVALRTKQLRKKEKVRRSKEKASAKRASKKGGK